MYFGFIILHFWQRVCMNVREKEEQSAQEQDVDQEARDGESERHHDLHTLFVSKHLCMYVSMYVMCECVMRG